MRSQSSALLVLLLATLLLILNNYILLLSPSLFIVSAERLPTIHGLIGPYLYFRVDAPNETAVNASTDIFLTIASLRTIQVHYLVAAVYGCGVNVSSILINESLLRANTSLSYVFHVTPRYEGFLRMAIAVLYSYYEPSTANYIHHYAHIAFNVTVVRVLTYRSLLERYRSLEEELETLRSNYEKLLNSFNNLTITYTAIAREYEEIRRYVNSLNSSLKDLDTLYANAVERLSRLEKNLLDLNTSYTFVSKSISRALESIDRLSSVYEDIKRGLTRINKTLISTLSDVASHQRSVGLRVNDTYWRVLSLEKMYRGIVEEQRSIATSFANLTQSYRALEQRYSDLSNAYATALQRINALGQELSSLRNLVLTLIIAVAVLATLLIIALLRK
jgi:archaellum component FlaC